MEEGTKQEIQVILELLKSVLIRNSVSMGLSQKKGKILFFDTETYLKEKTFSGFSVDIENLVK